jgi:hypothetical protein
MQPDIGASGNANALDEIDFVKNFLPHRHTKMRQQKSKKSLLTVMTT